MLRAARCAPFPFPFPFQSLSLCSSPFCIVAIFVVVASRRLTIFAGFTCKLDLIYCLTLPLQVGSPPPSASTTGHGVAEHGVAWPAAVMACNKILIDVVHLHANCCQLKSPSPYAAPPPSCAPFVLLPPPPACSIASISQLRPKAGECVTCNKTHESRREPWASCWPELPPQLIGCTFA